MPHIVKTSGRIVPGTGRIAFWRRWWFRWLLLPVALLVAVHAGWTLALKWQFEARLEELRAAGAPVDLLDLAPAPVPDEKNAAPLLDEAHRWYEEHLAADEPAPWIHFPESDWDDEQRAELRAWLAKSGPYFDLLRRAAARPGLWVDRDWAAGIDMDAPLLPRMQTASHYVGARVRYGGHSATDQVACIAVLLDLSAKMDRAFLIQALLRCQMNNTGADLIQEIARAPGFDPQAALAILEPRLAAADDLAFLTDALRNERALALSLTRRWLDGESPSVWALPFPRHDSAPAFEDRVITSWIFRPIVYRDGLKLLESMSEGLACLSLPAGEALDWTERLAASRECGFPYMVSSLFANLPWHAAKAAARHRATLRVARTGLALLSLREQDGTWPESLDAVAALVDAKTLVDPFSGQRLRYIPGEFLEADAPFPDEQLRKEYEIVWRFR